jgi:hypothetical protein
MFVLITCPETDLCRQRVRDMSPYRRRERSRFVRLEADIRRITLGIAARVRRYTSEGDSSDRLSSTFGHSSAMGGPNFLTLFVEADAYEHGLSTRIYAGDHRMFQRSDVYSLTLSSNAQSGAFARGCERGSSRFPEDHPTITFPLQIYSEFMGPRHQQRSSR